MKAPKLTWKRDEFGVYADSNTDMLRYYVRREGRKWYLEVLRSVEVAGIRAVMPHTNPVDVDYYHETAKLAKAVAEAYDVEPLLAGAFNRMTRAIDLAYSA